MTLQELEQKIWKILKSACGKANSLLFCNNSEKKILEQHVNSCLKFSVPRFEICKKEKKGIVLQHDFYAILKRNGKAESKLQTSRC